MFIPQSPLEHIQNMMVIFYQRKQELSEIAAHAWEPCIRESLGLMNANEKICVGVNGQTD